MATTTNQTTTMTPTDEVTANTTSCAVDPSPAGKGNHAVRTNGEVSAAECAELVGISRVSARRYLEHYLSTGELSLRLSVHR